MTNKAYIVANEQQEREVLEKLGEKGALWGNGEKAVNFIPFNKFPYVIYCNGDKFISWDALGDLDVNKIIVYDGRKEEQMSEKYVVSQEFMDDLEEWKKRGNTEAFFVGSYDISMLPDDIKRWWNYPEINNFECNSRLIAIIRWVNGEDVFEVEKPKKWVVRSKETNDDGCHGYVFINLHNLTLNTYHISDATRFDTKEEAESWANGHQEVVEVVDV